MNALLAAVALPILAFPLAAQEAASRPQTEKAMLLGSGAQQYAWVRGWGRLPDGHELGNTHGCIVIDKQGNVYVNTDTEQAVVVFAPDGKVRKTWGKEWKGGLHGMTLVEEGGKEFLYLAHTGRHEVCKTTLDGDVLWCLGYPEAAGIYKDKSQFKPTSVAVAPNGDLFVADGYGLSWVHQFDKERQWIRSFGGPGSAPGKMQTPHGLWLDTRRAEPVLIVADRENHRLQVFDLQGKWLRMVEGILRRPCNVHQRGDDLVVADLAGRVTILDKDDKLVAHLGENSDPAKWAQNGVPRGQWRDGEFIAPHSARWDAAGNLYVMDWNASGRVTKLERVTAK